MPYRGVSRPAPTVARGRPRARSVGGGARLLREGLRGSRRPFGLLAAWSVVEALPVLASGAATAAALDDGFLAGRPAVGLAWLGLLGLLQLGGAVSERAMFALLPRVVEPLRDSLVRRVVHGALDQAVYGGRTAPGLGAGDAAGVSRLSAQTDTVRALVGTLLRTARPLAVRLVATVVGLTTLSPVLAGVILPPLLLALAAFLLSMRTLAARRRDAVLAEEDVAARAGTVLAAARDLTALGAQASAAALVAVASDRSRRALVAVAVASAARVPIVLVGGYLPLFVLLTLGPRLIGHGAVGPGGLVGAATYLAGHLVPALQQLTGAVSGYGTQLKVVLDRLAETGTVATGRTDPAAPAGTTVGQVVGAPQGYGLVAADLTFAYGPAAVPVLDGLDLAVPEGDHLAVVGASGIGKSTLAGLLAGIETPGRGTVRIGGHPVGGLAEPVRCGLVTLLPQEAYVFPGTVRENLDYLAHGLGRDELDRAVAAVGLTEAVARWGGYDARLPDPGAVLSSGERQLIALARAFASPARLVILDEATCHLDPAAEALAESAFAARPGTLIVIAHRITSAARARRVLLLDGDHVALGAHRDLLADPRYAELVGHWSPDTALVTP
ncbi:ABC transporter ATP-binding protein/permease [Kitasatospora sp. NBC_01560]|uniref:ATP-binding cassette domain-containing protein n=1 Tax=Kitasatospora sp. NBC_01560 TaxID=2975965 RepID=UPI0038651D59